MSASGRFDVAIVGAGPTGLTLANLLGRAGLSVALVERRDSTVREPRAVSIDDESLRTMQAIGLADRVMADCALDYGSHYFTAAGQCFARVEPTTREYGFPRRNAFVQPKLEATLRDGLDRFPKVEPLFGRECLEVDETDDGLRLSLGGPTGARTIEARFLVGCDGARSTIRRRIGAALSGSTYDQPWLILDLGATRERFRQTRVVCDPKRPFITLPGPDGIRRYEFMLREGETEAEATEPGFVRALLAASGPDAEAPILRKQVYVFHARIADRWRLGRILLAGDAAHLSPPFAGQGMNSGLRDAHGLAWRLVEVVGGRLGEGLLDSYQSERAPHASALIDLAVNMGRVMTPRSRLQAWIVQSAFGLMRYAPSLHAYFAEMKYKPKPIYHSGFLARLEGGPSVAGRMIPQPCVETSDRRRLMLDERLGDGFALVAYGADAQGLLERARRLDLGLAVGAHVAILPQRRNPDLRGPELAHALRDVSDFLAGFLGSERGALMLVRPDRYVCLAAAVDNLEKFEAAARGLAASTAPSSATA